MLVVIVNKTFKFGEKFLKIAFNIRYHFGTLKLRVF